MGFTDIQHPDIVQLSISNTDERAILLAAETCMLLAVLLQCIIKCCRDE